MLKCLWSYEKGIQGRTTEAIAGAAAGGESPSLYAYAAAPGPHALPRAIPEALQGLTSGMGCVGRDHRAGGGRFCCQLLEIADRQDGDRLGAPDPLQGENGGLSRGQATAALTQPLPARAARLPGPPSFGRSFSAHPRLYRLASDLNKIPGPLEETEEDGYPCLSQPSARPAAVSDCSV